MCSKWITFILLIGLAFSSCDSKFLDAKPDKSLIVPSSIEDLQALLDNSNGNVFNRSPLLGLISSDDIYVKDDGYVSANYLDQQAYIWAKDLYGGNNVPDWETSYRQVFYSNVVLETMNTFDKEIQESGQGKAISGTALFYRGLAFFQIAQLFAEPYQKETAPQTPGIPLRLQADVSIKSTRKDLSESYKRMIKDVEQSIDLLPTNSDALTRPTKIAALALLARIYHSMEDYVNAEEYADQCLELNGSLLDYNTLPKDVTRPFPVVLRDGGNAEVIFYSIDMGTSSLLFSTLLSVDTNLYHSYDEDDLRKELFFRKQPEVEDVYRFRGSYTGSYTLFFGLATDEIYLIRSECRARAGDMEGALEDLNLLLENRWRKDTYTPFASNNPDEVLELVLNERRKELVFRNLRWSDIRRLNRTPHFQTTITRFLNGNLYQLEPNDINYILPIPEKVIANSGMEQNPRR